MKKFTAWLKYNPGTILPVLFSLCVATPIIVHAQVTGSETGGIVPCINDCNFNSLIGLINNIINWFLTIAVSVAAITFAIAGAELLFNQDKPAKLEDIKGIFGKTIIGLVIVLCAWLVIHTVIATLVPNAIQSGGALQFLGK